MVKLVGRLASSALIFAFIFFSSPATFAAAQDTPTAPQPPPPTCILTATPSSIVIGGSVTLKWTSQNATAGTISHIGSVGPNGAVNLLPSSASQTIFTGTFTGPGGTATCNATVTVGTATSGSSGTGGTGSTYSIGGTYDPGTVTPVTPYTINPSSFTSQPSGSTFTNTPTTVTTGAPTTNTGPSGFIVPCGSSQNANPSGLSYVDNATSCNICNLGTLAQNIINFLLMLSIPLAAGLFAWAGILRFTSRGNAGQVTKSTKIFTSVFIGFAIALSGYLIVQTLLNALLNPSFQSGGISFTSLTCSATGVDRPRHTDLGVLFQNLFSPTGTGTSGGTIIPGAGGAPSQTGTGDCSPAALASTWGTYAPIMSCIAAGESSCNAGRLSTSDKTADGKSFSVGLYQINLTQNDAPHNLNVPACEALNGGQPLNCSQAFSGTNYSATVRNQALYQTCVNAASNAACNTAAAVALFNQAGSGHAAFNQWSANNANNCGG